ncbi:O-antigen ligase family protein, partial [Clostridium perfringens]|uniref:O-antigen ligase family protein n=1 Tax=Clostridium perfringens TaxID=1502 RepID=UPI002ACC2BE1
IALIILPFLSVIFLFITNKASINNFLTGRDILWSTCFDVIKNNPIFGIGFTNLTNVLSEEKVLTLGRVHNIYIELAATNGLIALIVFIVILALIILFIFKKFDLFHYKQLLSYNVLFALIISIMSINLVESSLVYIVSFISIIFWVIRLET